MFMVMTIDKMGAVVLLLFSLISMISGLNFIMQGLIIFIEWELFSINSSSVVMTLLFDWMSLIFMGFVMFISSLIIYYSSEYMLGDLYITRFIIVVMLFVLSMMFLIVSPNIISILLGWDGLGLVSYCLVIYYQNFKSYSAGMLTALSNRIGDVGLLMAVAWMLNVGSWNYIYYMNSLKEEWCGFMVVVLIILAAMTKSAQIPFSAWLPAAMAAPTPVSALVHSSTLVTAGVYLLIRFSNIIYSYSELMDFLIIIGMLTMVMSGIGASLEYDLSKIIALSTLSQLGLMMSTLGLGASDMAFFHLLTHALFKALLFMCAGVIIHNMSNCQDIRFMGGLSWYMPITTCCFHIANLALCGMPFLAGFYSSDLILEYMMMSNMNMFMYMLFIFSTGLTVCYSFRLSYYSMTGDFQFIGSYSIKDCWGPMLKTMMVLMMMAVMGGSLLSWIIYEIPLMICLPWYMKFMIPLISLLGVVGGYVMPMLFTYSIHIFLMSSSFLGSMWFMPSLFTQGIIKVPLNMGEFTVKTIDQGWSEDFGSQSFYQWFMKFSQLLQWLQDNSLKIYLLSFGYWMVIIFFFFFIEL
uniref:NADH-ubiquinone oxidoreductase chain 5 n=1 Tax=Tegra novaehollandiae viridinotata TaxID=1945547 RepID=A0A1Q1MP52_9ORTH|nr:NADH dehydrogenase subunit 5 [Tegra novaehollandiae viridinotata]